MKEFLYILDIVYESYKTLLGLLFALYFFLFTVIGGSFKIEIYWDNVRMIFQ